MSIKTYKFKLYKSKKLDKFSFCKEVPSQAIQNITERIDNAYKKFFDYAKEKASLKQVRRILKKLKNIIPLH